MDRDDVLFILIAICILLSGYKIDKNSEEIKSLKQDIETIKKHID